MKKKISIVTPCYNEEAGIRECYLAVKKLFNEELPEYDYEHLFIDNCSQDKTASILRAIAAEDKNVKLIINSRNFGPAHSPYHAMLESTGDAYVSVVADLQYPVGLIVDFIRRWEDGADMVLGIRVGMSEAAWLRLARNAYYAIMSKLAHIEHYHGFSGYCLLSRKALDAIKLLNDPKPYVRGIISEIGFEKTFVEYVQPPRKHGKSKWGFLDLFDYAILGMVSCSKVPLRVMTVAGLIVSALSFLVGLAYMVIKLIYWDSFALGTAPVLIGTFFLASIQLFFLGMLGEYIGVIFDYVRKRPLVIERERINFD